MQPFVVAAWCCSEQTVEFARMGRQDHTLRQLLHPGAVARENVQRVGISDDGTLRASDLRDHGDGSRLLLTQSRSDSQGVVVGSIDGFREYGIVLVDVEHSLRHADLHDGAIESWGSYAEFAHTSPHASPRGEDGGASHTVAASYEEGVSHHPLVDEVASMADVRTDQCLFCQGVARVGLLHILLTQSDVQHSYASDKLLVVGKEEGEFLLVERQRQVGTDDVATDVERVVLGH